MRVPRREQFFVRLTEISSGEIYWAKAVLGMSNSFNYAHMYSSWRAAERAKQRFPAHLYRMELIPEHKLDENGNLIINDDLPQSESSSEDPGTDQRTTSPGQAESPASDS